MTFCICFGNMGVKMELGGNDQWSNILGGVDLVRRVEREEVYGLTFTLLTTKEGKKMGKTENGALWLDPQKTTPYEFFQYWRNVDDADVVNCLKLLTFLPIEEIEAMENWQGSELNKAKKILAYELTNMVHGKEEADKALEAAKALFSGGADNSNMPTTQLPQELFQDGSVGILDLLGCHGVSPVKVGRASVSTAGRHFCQRRKICRSYSTYSGREVCTGRYYCKKGQKSIP